MDCDSAPSRSCVGYTVTTNGCDMSAANCTINQTGLSNRTVSATSSQTAISCDANYSGSGVGSPATPNTGGGGDRDYPLH